MNLISHTPQNKKNQQLITNNTVSPKTKSEETQQRSIFSIFVDENYQKKNHFRVFWKFKHLINEEIPTMTIQFNINLSKVNMCLIHLNDPMIQSLSQSQPHFLSWYLKLFLISFENVPSELLQKESQNKLLMHSCLTSATMQFPRLILSFLKHPSCHSSKENILWKI